MDMALLLVAAESKRLDPGPDPLTAMLRFLVGIGVVFLLMWLLYRWVKRSSLGEYEGPGLRLVSRLALSRNTQVAVVEIGGRMFLVGAGDSAVTPIAELYDTEEMAAELENSAAAMEAATAAAARREPVKKPFSQILAKVTRKTASQPSPKKTVPKQKKTVSKEVTVPVKQAPPTKLSDPSTEPPRPTVTEAQMDALAAQIAAEFGVRPGKGGAS